MPCPFENVPTVFLKNISRSMKCDMNFSWCAALCSLFPSRLDRPCLAVDFVQCVVATTFQTSWSRLPSAKGLSVQCEPTARPGALISIKGNPVLRLSDRLKLRQIPGATYGGDRPAIHDENGHVHPDERHAHEAEQQHEAARPQIGDVVERAEPDRQSEAAERADHADQAADRADDIRIVEIGRDHV